MKSLTKITATLMLTLATTYATNVYAVTLTDLSAKVKDNTNAIYDHDSKITRLTGDLRANQGVTESNKIRIGKLEMAQSDNNKKIDDIKGSVAGNAKAIDKNKEAIANNAKDISNNSELISKNAENISKNKDAITDNTNAISENKKAIDSNSQAISKNQEDIIENTQNIDKLDGRVTKNENDIADNKKGISDNAKAISGNADAIISNKSDISKNRDDITNNKRDIGKLDERVTSNTTDIKNLRSETDVKFKSMYDEMGKNRDEARAGVASAMAMSSIPQAFNNGSGLIGMGVSTFKGQSAIAVGASKVSEDGHWITKFSFSGNTENDYAVSVGIGYQF